MRTQLRVGPASDPTNKFEQIIEWIEYCQSKSFTALELEFLRITASEYPDSEKMRKLAKYAEEAGVKLSIHGSFYINLAATNKKKKAITIEYLKQGIRVAKAASLNFIFHPGYFQKLAHREAIRKSISLLNSLNIPDPSFIFLEMPGKKNAIGDLSEMLEIAEHTGVQIGIDFAHYYARSLGKLRQVNDFLQLLIQIENTIGQKYFHMHISGIEYTKKGEKQHRAFHNSDFPVEIVIKALRELDYWGTLICESPKRWQGDTELLLQLVRGENVSIFRKNRATLDDFL
ncbi:MAG: TIM barrel protein [Candidatus Helarchaeota archaeon]